VEHAEHGARRPPGYAAEIGRERGKRLRLQHVGARERAVGQNGRDLQPDDKGGADDRGEDLRDQPGALGPDDAEKRNRERNRNRGRGRAHRQDHAIGAEPVRAAPIGEHVDEGAGKRQRHGGDRKRRGGDAHSEQFTLVDRRSEDEIEVGARIEGARDRFHRLRHHQEPRQQDGRGDGDQKALVDDGRVEAADRKVGDHVHADHEGCQAERNAAAARRLAGGHHCHPIAPGEPRFVACEPDRGAGLYHGAGLTFTVIPRCERKEAAKDVRPGPPRLDGRVALAAG